MVGIAIALVLLAGVGGVITVFLGSESSTRIIRSRGYDGVAPAANDSLRRDVEDPGIDIIGADGGPTDAIVAAAIADLEQWWGELFPELFGRDYEPVTGGFYAWSPDEPLPACVEDVDEISGNAYYCGYADEVAWDDTGFLTDMYENYGDLAVAVVIAHEWGHAIQARLGFDPEPVTAEQQADCYSGAWVARAMDGDSPWFEPDARDMDFALAGFLELGDMPGSSALDPAAHGSSFDRIHSFQEGFEEGAATCARYDDENVMARLVQIEFLDFEDRVRGGDAPYDEIFGMIDDDLNDYWSYVGPEVFGADFEPLAAATPFDGVIGARCGDEKVDDTPVFYCDPDRSVFYDDDGYMPTVYDSFGDFGVALEYSLEFNAAALSQYDAVPDDADERFELVECISGAWTASIFLGDRHTSAMRLSAGDFDEALQVIIATSADAEPGSAFARVRTFRAGVMGGIGACVG